jgi:valyl-tRNA synthetase
MTAVDNADEAQRYDPREIQDKWQEHWAAVEPFRASDDPADPRERYLLVDMFPYPSGDLHMGHAEAYAIGDAMARYWFLRGNQEQRAPDRLDLQEHRDAGGVVPPVRDVV